MPVLVIIAWAAVLLTIFTATSASLIRIRKPTVAHDGHVLRRENDITCETQYGHNHPRIEEFNPDGTSSSLSGPTPRYIVHDDPEEGYVVLNGIKRKLEDCKYF